MVRKVKRQTTMNYLQKKWAQPEKVWTHHRIYKAVIPIKLPSKKLKFKDIISLF